MAQPPSPEDELQGHVEKTYNQILAKREAKLSKDALVERRALQITRYFMRESEKVEEEKLQKDSEMSRMNYDRDMLKFKADREATLEAKKVAEEEKAVIFDLMAEKIRQKKEEEAKEKAKKEEREKWKQARVLYEQMQAKERERLKKDLEKERREQMLASTERHKAAEKGVSSQQDEELKAAQAKVAAELLKTVERRKKLVLEARQ
ncbi:unnamed protein product, partial [Polarella glacialis]